MFTVFSEVILATFFPIVLLLFILGWFRSSSKPLVAAAVLFVVYSFDSFVRNLPFLFSLEHHRIGSWNWEGGLFSFFWPLIIVFLFNVLTADEVGLKFHKPLRGIFYGLTFGLILGGWNIFDGYFLTELPSKSNIESIAYHLFVPALSEELVYRGLFLAILDHYLGKEWKTNSFSFGWGIILVSLLFILVHLINIDRATGQLIWTGTINLLGNILVATSALAYLRIKTESIMKLEPLF